jgi:hypothetical protein
MVLDFLFRVSLHEETGSRHILVRRGGAALLCGSSFDSGVEISSLPLSLDRRHEEDSFLDDPRSFMLLDLLQWSMFLLCPLWDCARVCVCACVRACA